MSVIRVVRRRSGSNHLGRLALTYLSLILFTLIVLLPFFWIAKSAFSSQAELFKIPPVYIPNPTFDNFRTLAEQVPLGQYILNSLRYATATAILSVALSYLAAYAFARIPVRGGKMLMWVLVLSISVPEITTIVPLYRVLKNLGMLNTISGLVLITVSTLGPFTVWVLVAFIQQVPREIEEAATIDGASLLQVIWRIMAPVTAPALATMVVINFVNAWNNLLYPLTFSATPDALTLSVAITQIFNARAPWGRPWNLVSVIGVTMVTPMILLVLVSQRAIVRGLTRGAIK
jgi:ABC-type glycerol-3-phosphate transport system permease component